MTGVTNAEIIQDTYTLGEVLGVLTKIRGRRIPRSTFYQWRSDASIGNKYGGEPYTLEELDRLKKICRDNEQYLRREKHDW